MKPEFPNNLRIQKWATVRKVLSGGFLATWLQDLNLFDLEGPRAGAEQPNLNADDGVACEQ